MVSPGPGQEGIVIQYQNVIDDMVVTEALNICSVFNDPDDLDKWNNDFDVPDWFFEIDTESRDRLKN